MSGHLEVVRLLLSAGARKDVADFKGTLGVWRSLLVEVFEMFWVFLCFFGVFFVLFCFLGFFFVWVCFVSFSGIFFGCYL